jgi:Flp pilus assembly pilin Flp
MRFSFLSLRRSQHGATAIEYAILAGLIGLGLVGSLVATRGSLSTVFGTASSRMGSAGGESTAAGNAWASKTLVGPPTKQTYQKTVSWTYQYTDGSYSIFYRNADNQDYNNLATFDKSSHMVKSIFVNFDGTPFTYNERVYNAANTTALVQNETDRSAPAQYGGNPPVPVSMRQTDLSTMVQTTMPPTQAFVASANAALADYGFFEGMSK